jgi:hypothetical protein
LQNTFINQNICEVIEEGKRIPRNEEDKRIPTEKKFTEKINK